MVGDLGVEVVVLLFAIGVLEFAFVRFGEEEEVEDVTPPWTDGGEREEEEVEGGEVVE